MKKKTTITFFTPINLSSFIKRLNTTQPHASARKNTPWNVARATSARATQMSLKYLLRVRALPGCCGGGVDGPKTAAECKHKSCGCVCGAPRDDVSNALHSLLLGGGCVYANQTHTRATPHSKHPTLFTTRRCLSNVNIHAYVQHDYAVRFRVLTCLTKCAEELGIGPERRGGGSILITNNPL